VTSATCVRPQRVTIQFETGDPLECCGLAGGVGLDHHSSRRAYAVASASPLRSERSLRTQEVRKDAAQNPSKGGVRVHLMPRWPGRITNLTRRHPRWSRFREESRDAPRRRFPVRDPPPRQRLRDGGYRVESDEHRREPPRQLHLQFRLHERQLSVRPLLPIPGFFQQPLHVGLPVRRGQLSDGLLLAAPAGLQIRFGLPGR
jgi:hypothetical protein